MDIGLVSVSFRKLSAEEIVEITKKAGLKTIEWGADIHVPAGNLSVANHVRKITGDAGLRVAGYGSYFVAGKHTPEEFTPILNSAIALGAPAIRVWAGAKASDEATEEYAYRVVECTKAICDMALPHGILICYEYHPGTMCDTPYSAIETLRKIEKPNMRLYWQPDPMCSYGENCVAIQMVSPYLQNVHMFCCDAQLQRYPLQEGRAELLAYAEILKQSSNVDSVMLEFVKNDDTKQFFEDAKTLSECV